MQPRETPDATEAVRQAATNAQYQRAESDLAKLDIAFRIWAHHHNSIWEEQKHFMWLISIVLSAQLLVLTSNAVPQPGRTVLAVTGSLVGVLLALTGLSVQRREGFYFWKASAQLFVEYNEIFRDRPMGNLPPSPNKTLISLVVAFFTGRAGVRDSFQVLFLCFMLVFFLLPMIAAFS